MEEIEERLHSNNSINTTSLISKIIDNIRKKYQKGLNLKDIPEIKFLKEKFLCTDPLISEVSGIALKLLITDEILTVENVTTDLLSRLDSVKCYSSLIDLLGDLLYLQSKNKVVTYNVSNPQHPFITLVNKNPQVTPYLLNKLKNLQEEIKSDVHKIFEPFYLYSLCCPSTSVQLLKYRLWNFLIQPQCVNEVPRNFYFNILGWFQVERRDDLEIAADQIIEIIEVSLNDPNFLNFDLLILWQLNILHNLSKYKLNLRSTLSSLNRNLRNRNLAIIDSVLIILSQIIDNCSPLHLDEILKLCEILIKQNKPTIYSLQTMKAALLQWLSTPCTLTNLAYNTALHIINTLNESQNKSSNNGNTLRNFYGDYKDQICTNKNIFVSINISLKLELFKKENELKNWIELVKKTSQEFKLDVFNFLCGLLLIDYENPDISIDILDILVKCSQIDVYLTPKLLTLMFYKISNNKQPKFNLALLKSFPKMVILRENIPKVIAIIQSISKGSENLYNVGLSLAFDAWKIDNKCYMYLEDLLVQNPPTKKKWERHVIKAVVLKELCDKKPELYGKDAVAHLSKILNDCNDENGALPCSIAIEAITVLCKAGIIDIKTTWATLSPKFNNDIRYPVVKSLCHLIEEVPQLSYVESHKELFDEVLLKLWQYVDLGDAKISDVALSSLTTFGIEYICKSLPEKYLEVNVVNNINSVTGKTWVRFLMENNASQASINFTKKMIANEIDEYLKYVYHSKATTEPVNYSYLPSHSVVRAIGEFIKTWVVKWKGSIHDKFYIECLKILSVEYSKPLPPLDWCFLQELIHEPRCRKYAVDIACHQVVLSGTARRLVENYVTTVTESPQEEDIDNVYRNLKFLAKSIQPIILRPFFEATLWYSIKKYNQNELQLLINISEYVKTVLVQKEVQETNKLNLVQVLDSIIFVTELNTPLFDVLCQTIIHAPTDCLKRTGNFKNTDSEEAFVKNAKIRFALSKISTTFPLAWLDEIISTWSNLYRNLDLRKDLSSVLERWIETPEECVPWIMELIGQIQANIADRCELPIVSFQFDILIFAVVTFSGNHVFLSGVNRKEELWNFFPQSLASLLDRRFWEACSVQVLEWLYHMNTEESVPKTYRRLFGVCLQSLKHNDEFLNKQRWLKLLNCTIFD
ncbi:unnamed protein product [Phyllotreta striolata]|uniref:DUF3730 domain-containing protein n=1 Tax=Phyllotreta striolata TaxID=444603 RepID=A0A9N9TQ28_PHYSR|nr:unnamed protein product [Phyllotreta striolata]